MNLQKLQEKLPVLPNFRFIGSDFVEVLEKPYSFIRDDKLFISGENGDNACDYYGEFRGGYAYINPILEEFAKKNGGFFEWENPACIVFCKS